MLKAIVRGQLLQKVLQNLHAVNRTLLSALEQLELSQKLASWLEQAYPWVLCLEVISEGEKLRSRKVDLPRDATVMDDSADLPLFCHLRDPDFQVLVIFRLLRGFTLSKVRLEVNRLVGTFAGGARDGLCALIDRLVLAEDAV